MLTSIACIPKFILKDTFDRNASIQFVALAISASCVGLYMAVTNKDVSTRTITIDLNVLKLED